MKRATLLKRRGHDEAGDGVDRDATERRRIAGERPNAKPTAEPEATAAAEPTVEPEPAAPSAPPSRRGRAAAAIAFTVGLVVGLLIDGLVYGGMRSFDAIYDTPAGGWVGAIVLACVLVVAVLAGRYLLRSRGLPDPSATALLGILLMLIVTLAALIPIVFSVWMLVITPLMGGLAFLAAHLLIARFGSR